MSYIKGNRYQLTMLPASIEEYIAQDDPVRAYDAFVEALELEKLGIIIDENQAGANSYWPKAMLKLLIYGYAYGLRSSRRLERACHHNLSFIWLAEGIKPDYRTIARFRVDNLKVVKQVLHQCAKMCIKLELIEGNTLFTDGTKIKANASYNESWTKEDCQRWEEKITKNIESILSECEQIDQQEDSSGSLIKLKQDLASQEALQAKIQSIKQELESSEKSSYNTTDPDSFIAKGDRGTKAYHNAQMSVDEKHGLIITTQIVSQPFDNNQLHDQYQQAKEVLDKKPQTICADAGYHSISDIEKIDSSVTVVVPSQTQIIKERTPEKVNLFSKEAFSYDKEKDHYICPKGNILYRTTQTSFGKKDSFSYKAKAADCKACHHFGICTTSRQGRKIVRLKNETLLQKLAQTYASADGQRVYKLRKERAELPFAYIKHNLNMRQLLLCGTEKVSAEFNLCAISYNLRRMINLIGVSKLTTAIATG